MIVAHKRAVLDKVVAVDAKARARPELLGRQLTTLFEGATALATPLDDYEPFVSARSAAEVLISAATGPAGPP